MSAEGFVAIPKSPTTEAWGNTTSISGVVAAGKEKKEKEKEKRKKRSKPISKGLARGSPGGAEDDTEWVLSESVTVVGLPTTQSSDSIQFDTKEDVKRRVSSLGTASPAPTASSTTSNKRESRSGAARSGGVEVRVVQEEWKSVPERNNEDASEVENGQDVTPPVQRVIPTAAAVHPSPSPYAPGPPREMPVQPFPPPYAAPLPQMQHYLHHQASLPQMQGLPMHQNNVPAMANLLAAPHLAALLPQFGAGMLQQPQATMASVAATQNLLAGLAPLLAAANTQAHMLQPALQTQQLYQGSQQQPQQLQQALELYLALANMNLALSAEHARNSSPDSQ
ncbi:hypothetical protein M407DRAFT_18457 [Tulasnella calospora MUT 4182]|nr:hypothetical protein M407DRAFT_18457 [Tulasnella calospora MUT 4182]